MKRELLWYFIILTNLIHTTKTITTIIISNITTTPPAAPPTIGRRAIKNKAQHENDTLLMFSRKNKTSTY